MKRADKMFQGLWVKQIIRSEDYEFSSLKDEKVRNYAEKEFTSLCQCCHYEKMLIIQLEPRITQ